MCCSLGNDYAMTSMENHDVKGLCHRFTSVVVQNLFLRPRSWSHGMPSGHCEEVFAVIAYLQPKDPRIPCTLCGGLETKQ